MTDAFSDRADFSGISPMALKIFDVVHKAFVSVTETATEAAAATGIVAVPGAISWPRSMPVVFNADHPFLFVIRDRQSGSVLFEGQVADPTSAGADPSAPPIPVSETKPGSHPVDTTVSALTVRAPLTPPLPFQGSNNPILPGRPITATVATAFVPVVAQSPDDPSRMLPIGAVLSHTAVIYWSGPKADNMPAKASGPPQPDRSVAVQGDLSAGPSAASSAQEDTMDSAPSPPGLAAPRQDEVLAADTLPIFMDPVISISSVQKRT